MEAMVSKTVPAYALLSAIAKLLQTADALDAKPTPVKPQVEHLFIQYAIDSDSLPKIQSYVENVASFWGERADYRFQPLQCPAYIRFVKTLRGGERYLASVAEKVLLRSRPSNCTESEAMLLLALVDPADARVESYVDAAPRWDIEQSVADAHHMNALEPEAHHLNLVCLEIASRVLIYALLDIPNAKPLVLGASSNLAGMLSNKDVAYGSTCPQSRMMTPEHILTIPQLESRLGPVPVFGRNQSWRKAYNYWGVIDQFYQTRSVATLFPDNPLDMEASDILKMTTYFMKLLDPQSDLQANIGMQSRAEDEWQRIAEEAINSPQFHWITIRNLGSTWSWAFLEEIGGNGIADINRTCRAAVAAAYLRDSGLQPSEWIVERGALTIRLGGEEFRSKFTNSYRDLQYLIQRTGKEVHVCEMRKNRLSKQEVTDAKALMEYDIRLREIDCEIDGLTAHEIGYADRRTDLEHEKNEILKLRGTYKRRSRDFTDRIRSSVAMNIKRILECMKTNKLDKMHKHFCDSISTGFTCSYKPRSTTWKISSYM